VGRTDRLEKVLDLSMAIGGTLMIALSAAVTLMSVLSASQSRWLWLLALIMFSLTVLLVKEFEGVRRLILFLYRFTRRLDPLAERANHTAIGFSGNISMLDHSIAEERELKPLNRFERWLLKPAIEAEQKRRREAWRQSIIEVTGDDPDTDWL